MLKTKPSPYPWLLAAALTALLAGSLFRAYAQTHVGFFRMFGTIGVVAVGYFATRTFYALQEGEALDRLAAALASLPEGIQSGPAVSVRHPQGRGRLVIDLTVVGRRALLLVAVDATRPVAGTAAALAARRRHAHRLWTARRALSPRLEALGEVPLSGAILSLYRDVPPEGEHVDGIAVFTPETFAGGMAVLDEQAAARELDPKVRARLLEVLR